MSEEKNLGGRPPIYDPEEVADKLLAYIDETEDPMVEEFCFLNPYSKDTVYRLEKKCVRLSDAIKKLHAKQMIRTIRLAEKGKINPTWAIFKMKQPCYGMTDKQEMDLNVKEMPKITIKRSGE